MSTAVSITVEAKQQTDEAEDEEFMCCMSFLYRIRGQAAIFLRSMDELFGALDLTDYVNTYGHDDCPKDDIHNFGDSYCLNTCDWNAVNQDFLSGRYKKMKSHAFRLGLVPAWVQCLVYDVYKNGSLFYSECGGHVNKLIRVARADPDYFDYDSQTKRQFMGVMVNHWLKTHVRCVLQSNKKWQFRVSNREKQLERLRKRMWVLVHNETPLNGSLPLVDLVLSFVSFRTRCRHKRLHWND